MSYTDVRNLQNSILTVKFNIVRTQAIRALIMERNARRSWFALTRHETEGTSEDTALVNSNL